LRERLRSFEKATTTQLLQAERTVEISHWLWRQAR